MRKLLTALLFVTSAGLSLVAMEVLVRVLEPRHDPAGSVAFHYNDDHLYLGRKNTTGRQWRASGEYDVTVAFNDHGFRDAKDLRRSIADSLFVVGDSYSFGWGVEAEQRYSNLLQEMTGREVYNISIPTSIQGYARLVGYARERGATVANLIVGICMENDLKDYDAPRPPPPEASRLKRVKQYLKRRTALYSIVSGAVHGNARLTELAVYLGLIGWDGKWQRPSAVSEAVLASSAAQTAALVAGSGARQAAVLVIPSRTLWLGDERAVARSVHDDFVSRLRELDLTVVDLRPAFEAEGRPLAYHFRFDGHWNPAGHRLAAETLYAQAAEWLHRAPTSLEVSAAENAASREAAFAGDPSTGSEA